MSRQHKPAQNGESSLITSEKKHERKVSIDNRRIPGLNATYMCERHDNLINLPIV